MTQNHKKTQVKSAALSMLVVASMLIMAMGIGTTGVKAATVKETGGDLVIGIYNAPQTTNPTEAASEEWIMNYLYDSLAVYKPSEGVLPWLADSWEVAPDNVTVNVTLKTGVTFTDGAPLTALDVVSSYQTYMATTDCIYNSYVSYIQGVFEIDEHTVQFVLKSPNSDFFTKGLMVPIMEQYHQDVGTGPFMDYATGSRTGTDTNVTLNDPNDAGTRVGGTNVNFQLSHGNVDPASVTIHEFAPILNNTGAFVGTNWSAETTLNSTEYDVDSKNGTLTIHTLDEFDYVTVDFTFTQDIFTLSVNSDYFMGRAYIDSATFVVEGKDAAAVDDINNGRIDVIFDQVDPYYKSVVKGANVLTPLTTNTIELRINCGVVPLNNSDFRKAISYVVDKESFVSDTLMKSGIVGDSVIPRDNLFWYNSSLSPRPYSKGAASSILTSAGFTDKDGDGYVDLPDGSPFSLSLKSVGITEDNYLAAEAQVVSVILGQVGINTTWIVEPGDNVSADMHGGNFDLVMTRMSYPLDPSYLNDFVTGNANNFMHYSNANFDAVMEKANTVMDLAMKQQYIKQAQGVLYEDTAVVVLTYLNGLQLYDGTKYDGYYNMINGINNKFSLLEVYHVIVGSLDMAITSPDSSDSGDSVTITVTVANETSNIEGAKVELTVSAGTLSQEEVITGASGTAEVTLTLPTVDELTDVTITAKAYKAGYIHTEKSATITVHPLPLPELSVSIEKPQGGIYNVGSENSTTITVTVTSAGEPVANATVEAILDPSITGANISLSSPTTNSNGQVTVTFTAPKTSTDISYTLTAIAHKDGYMSSSGQGRDSSVQIYVKGAAPENPTAKTDQVPGFEAITALAAISLAGAAFEIRRKKRK